MILFDAVKTGAVRRTADGYLVADARVARAGVQEYSGAEVGKPDLERVRLYRPPEVVFSEDSMRSYAHRPMTLGHPPETVSSKNWKRHAVGSIGGDVVRDGDFVRVPLVLMDQAAIDAYEAGTAELSMGYLATVEFKDGVTPEGEAYDAVVTKLPMNHCALVDRARGGAALRIGDDNPQETQAMTNEVKTQTVLVDGLSVVTTDAGAQAISKLQGQLRDAEAAKQKLISDHAAALADRDGKLAKAEAERDAATAKVLTDAQIDAKVKERADLLALATTIADGNYAGMAPAEIRKAVVVAKLGDAAVKDRSDAYIEARFEILADEAKADPVRKALGDQRRTTSSAGDNGQDAYEKRLSDSWKNSTHQQKGA